MGQTTFPVATPRYHSKATAETIKAEKSPNDGPVTSHSSTKSPRVPAQTATKPTTRRKDWSWPTKIRRPSPRRRNSGPGSGPSVVSNKATSTSPRKEVAVDTRPCQPDSLRRITSCSSSKSGKSDMKIPKGDFLRLPGILLLSRKTACFCLTRIETKHFFAHSEM